MAEAIAAVPQLQLCLTRAMGRSAKQQTWAAELSSGEHLNVLAELLPTVLISRRDGIKQHHPIQTGQTEGLLQTPCNVPTGGDEVVLVKVYLALQLVGQL